MKNRSIIAAIFSAFFAVCIFCRAADGRFQGTNAEFSIDLPAGWKAMDPQVLDALADPFGEDNMAAQGRKTRYGYMPPISDTVTNPPYLMVEVCHTRRLPDKLMALQNNTAFLKQTITDMLKKQGVLERNILEIGYDANQHVVRFTYTQIAPLGIREENRISKWVNFTENGSINFSTVCSKQGWEQWSNAIGAAIASARIADNLRYRPHPADKAVATDTMTKDFFTVIGMVLFAGIAYIAYQRKCNTVMSDEI